MSGCKTASKQPSKLSRQLLFSEALRHQGVPPAEEHPLSPSSSRADTTEGATMDRILQEISVLGHKLDGMDSAMASLMADTKSMRLDLAGFQSQVTCLDQRVTSAETHIAAWVDRDQELLYLHSKLIDLEDRSHRNNVRFRGFPENIEGADIHSYVRDTVPKLTGITFDPPLEFQRVHRLGSKRRDGINPPHPIIACLLCHVQTRQLLQAAQAHGPFRSDALEVRLTADFSKETSERRRAFLSLRPRLRQLDVKYSLLEPARMWITKNGESRDFYDPDDLRVFLEGLQNQTQSMVTATPIHPDMLGPLSSVALLTPAPEVVGQTTADSHPRGRDLERLTKSHDDRGQVPQAVAIHTQITDRDKYRSPLKSTLTLI
ncbi:hypothetical protein NDU88_007859 [Pleurodeles waltl]|uniref:Uncharacterized protein n=1 Tax=Pleurodeles waltl TaxID=8319 RepID=A0AAV7QR61_PLEWA|nr:hypothetical protein NDU88_007859 [Pleurodeles waltl]